MEKYSPETHLTQIFYYYYGTGEWSGFEQDYCKNPRYVIKMNVPMREIVFDVYFQWENIITNSIGIKISDEEFEELVPLIRCEDFDDMKDLKNIYGYNFKGSLCIGDNYYQMWVASDNGLPLYEVYMFSEFFEPYYTYTRENIPPQEQLLRWIYFTYSSRKELTSKGLYIKI